MDESTFINEVESELKKLSEMMRVDAELKCELSTVKSQGEDQKMLKVNYIGDGLGYMIGNGGRHLKSLQYMLSLYLNRRYGEQMGGHFFVTVDVSDYLKSKNDKLEKLALRMADDARILGEPVDMEPMSASERRVVHMALDQFDDITTESYGEEPDRYIRIIPKSEADLGVVRTGETEEEEAEE